MKKLSFQHWRRASSAGAAAGRLRSAGESILKSFRKYFPGGDRKPYSGYQLELRCRGRLIISENTRNLKKIVTIGKAQDNDWRIPEDDGSCGSHHVRLITLGNRIDLIAVDNNFLYFKGEQVKRCTLRKNDRAAFGDSELFVKKKPAADKNICDAHRLEHIGGEADGTMIRLEKSPWRIGSAPDNELVLNSDVVSRYHAEIRIAENGETWLKDLRSSNGTWVNGERLSSHERMLMDSDELSFAQFKFRFLDRNVVHVRTQFGKKLIIMGATVLLVLFGFVAFYLSSPSTETVINAVDFYLFRNQFDAAERMLAKMPDSHGFQRYEKQYREYKSRIPRCREIYNSMLVFQDHLKNSRWHEAAECYGNLDIGNSQVWNPANPRTPETLQEITNAKNMLGRLLALIKFNASSYNTKSEVIDLWKKLMPQEQQLKATVSQVPDYQKPLYRELLSMLSELDNNVKTLRLIDKKAEVLAHAPTLEKLDEFTAFLNHQDRVTGTVRVYIRDLTSILEVFRGSLMDLKKNDMAIFDLRMKDVRPIFLISTDECIYFPRLYKLKKRIEEHYHRQMETRDNWLGIQRFLKQYQLGPGTIPEEIRFFSDEKRIERILDLPEIAKNPAVRTLKEYDRVFGERYFYEVIQQTVHSNNNIYASDLVPNMKTVPKCILLKDLYRGIDEALLWMNLPRNKWILHGNMEKTRKYYQELMATRPPILQSFRNIASRSRGSRKYYLAMTAYFYFAPKSPDIPPQMQAFAREWRKFRLNQQNLLNQYDPLNVKVSQQIHDTIVARGIPGDPVFNWIRNQK